MHVGALHIHQIENLTKPVIDTPSAQQDHGFDLGKSTKGVAVEFDLLLVRDHRATGCIDNVAKSHAPHSLWPEVAESNGEQPEPSQPVGANAIARRSEAIKRGLQSA